MITWLVLVVLAAAAFPFVMIRMTRASDDPSVEFIANLYARKDALLASAESGPRLVIVGGSGALFSVRAEMLSRATGMPAINMGTHAGLGPEMLLARARRGLRAGDRVVLLPEYNTFGSYPRRKLETRPWQWACTYDRIALREVGISTSFRTTLTATTPALSEIREIASQPPTLTLGPRGYPCGSLTPTGDMAWLPKRRADLKGAWVIGDPDASDPNWARPIRDFLDWANANDVEVAIAWPICKPNDDLRSKAQGIEAAVREIASSYNVPVLGTLEDSFYIDADFADTGYHAVPAAAVRGTWQLIGALSDIGWSTVAADGPPVLLGSGSTSGRTQARMIDAGVSHSMTDVHDIAAGTSTVYTDDPGMLLQLLENGWKLSSTIHESWQAASLVDQFPNHVFALSGMHSDLSKFGWLPITFADDEPFSAIVGTGKYADIHRVSDNQQTSVWVNTTLETRNGVRLPHRLGAFADGNYAWVEIDQALLTQRQTRAGVNIAVLDPATGVVVESMHPDPAGNRLTKPLFRLERGDTQLERTENLLSRFIPTGTTKPKLQTDDDGLHVYFTGNNSFVAIPVDADSVDKGMHWLDLTVYVAESTYIDLFSWTTGNGHLHSTPPATRHALPSGFSSVQIPFQLDENDSKPVYLGLRANKLGKSLTISAAAIVSTVDNHIHTEGN